MYMRTNFNLTFKTDIHATSIPATCASCLSCYIAQFFFKLVKICSEIIYVFFTVITNIKLKLVSNIFLV